MNGRNTFHSAAVEYLSRLTIKNVSFILYYLESDGLITFLKDEYLARTYDQRVFDCFAHLFSTQYHSRIGP